MKLQGIAASPGIGIGPVYCLEHEEYSVTEAPVRAEDVDAEITRFRVALEASRRELSRLRDGIASELGESAAGIYDAHVLMVEDPELVRSVEHGIRAELRNAAFVFRRYMSVMAAHFDRIEDEYLRERRADIVDVERRVLRHLFHGHSPSLVDLARPSIVVAHDIGPSEVAMLDPERVLGLVTEVGGRTSHSAIVARGRGIPAVLSVSGVLERVKSGDVGAVDGYAGHVEVNPDAKTAAEYQRRQVDLLHEVEALDQLRDAAAITLDGHEIEIGANIELPADVERALRSGATGIGLFRTEFFYLGRYQLPTEAEQYDAYRMVAERMKPYPVIFRTMDLGGDKVASYLGASHETNPFLGWRGIRFALQHPDVFETQIRAIYRASAHGRVRMMFPMVSNLGELERTLEICAKARTALSARGEAFDPDVEVGVMVETPSAVWIADVLMRYVAFLSIGTNDLVQYTLAMDRHNERLANLYEPLEPSILRSIHHAVQAAHAMGRWAGICGEMAGDPRHAVLLAGMGVDEMSMSFFDLPRVKAAIRSVRIEEAREIAVEALALPSSGAVKRLLRERVEPLLPSYLLAKRSLV
jgi:phosphotransferase system enzyme I (PtsI)